MKRHRLSRKKSRRTFRKNTGVHPKNMRPAVMRGGIRL